MRVAAQNHTGLMLLLRLGDKASAMSVSWDMHQHRAYPAMKLSRP